MLALYDSLRHTDGCTWDEDYPGMIEIDGDIQKGDLYIDTDGRCARGDQRLRDDELEEMNVWSGKPRRRRDRSCAWRRADAQNRGIAREMVRFALNELKKRASGAFIYWLDARIAAQRRYAPVRFKTVAETEKYGVNWQCMEGEL